MADILHEEIFSSLNFRLQSCPRKGGGGNAPPLLKVGGGGSCPPCPPPPPFSYTTALNFVFPLSSGAIFHDTSLSGKGLVGEGLTSSVVVAVKMHGLKFSRLSPKVSLGPNPG